MLPCVSARYLNFDMARVFEEFFDENPAVVKAGLPLPRRSDFKPVHQFFFVVGHAHALAAAAAAALIITG